MKKTTPLAIEHFTSSSTPSHFLSGASFTILYSTHFFHHAHKKRRPRTPHEWACNPVAV